MHYTHFNKEYLVIEILIKKIFTTDPSILICYNLTLLAKPISGNNIFFFCKL
jgi:hypothetical protein